MAFLYEDIQWSGTNTTIGFNAGDGVRSFTLPESLTAEGVLNLENTSNVGIPGVYIFRVDQNEVETPSTVIPGTYVCMYVCMYTYN